MDLRNTSKNNLIQEVIRLRQRVGEIDVQNKKAVEVAQNPEEVIRLIFENAAEAIYIVQEGFINYGNSKLSEILSFSQDELMSRPSIEFVHPDDRDEISARSARRFRGEYVPNLYPHRLLDKWGNVKWMETNTVVVTWYGRPAQLHLVNNITEKKKIEEAFNESENLLADIINFLPDATFAIDSNGKVIVWNRAVEMLTGVSSKDVVGKADYAHALAVYGERKPILIDKVLNPTLTAMETYLSFNVEKDCLLAETEIMQKGQLITFWCKAGPIYDISGKSIGAIESLRDITALKEMNTALKVLVHQCEIDNRELEDKFLLNVKELVLPHVMKLKAANLDLTYATHVDIIEDLLKDIISPFLANLTSKYSQLTPREV